MKNLSFPTKFTQKSVFWVKNKKCEHHQWIPQIRISLSTKFQLKMVILIFWIKVAQKRYFPSKKKIKHRHWIRHIQFTLITEIQLKTGNFNFWTKFSQKSYSWRIKKSEHHHWFLHFWISLAKYLGFKWQICLFQPNSPKNCISSQEHHHWILNIWSNLGTEFNVNLTVSILWTKFAQIK